VTSSLGPIEQTLAVSEKVIPFSTAFGKKGLDCSRSSTHERHCGDL
jgi:hypothetical protein